MKNNKFVLSKRCQILRDDAVNIKSHNQEISYVQKVLKHQGLCKADPNYDNIEIMATGLVHVLESFPAKIWDEELIVGYNYGDCSSPDNILGDKFDIENSSEYREILSAQGFDKKTINDFFEKTPYYHWDAPEPKYNVCEQNMHDEWAAIGRCIQTDHNILGYEDVLAFGFEGLLEKICTYEKKNGSSSFYRATKQICTAACKIGEKYALEARRIMDLPDITSQRKAELQEIYETCLRVPKYPARTLMEAAQSLWFAHIITTWEDNTVNANSLGRLDQILYPYYKRDLEEGRITKEQAFEIICCLWIKLYRDYDVQQSCVGGCTPDGQDAVNDLSYMMLDATEAMNFIRCLSVRYDRNTSPDFLKRSLEVVGHLQKGVPFYFNDEVMIPSLVNAGIKLEDARDYSQIGCIETAIPGKSNPHAVTGETNLLKAIEYALNDGKSMISEIFIEGVDCPMTAELTDYEKLKNAVFAHIENILNVTCRKVVEHTNYHAIISPRPYKALLTKGCLESGRDFNSHGALYDFYQIMLGGIPNLADSLMAVKKLVYEEKKYTMEQLVYQLKNDFPDELVRLDFLNHAPKYGNDIDEVDNIAVEITEFSCDCLERLSKELGYAFHAQPFTYLWLIEHGANTAATPDGRHKGENIAYSVSPMQGRDFNGLTAVFNSLVKFPTQRTPGTTSAIVEVDPHLFIDKNLDIFTQMLLTLAEKGLSNVQFNITDAETLKDAKKHPEKYQNLAVRVSGFSQKFYLLNDQLQDHIIERTKHQCL